MARVARLARHRLRSHALVLRRTPLREADLIVELFTEEAGSVTAVARGARRSAKRIAALEPMHVLSVGLDIAPARELATLAEASLARPRLSLTSSLARMEAAGRVLRWLRRAAPPRSPEPGLWREANACLDALDDPALEQAMIAKVCAATGLRLLTIAGWGLELERCVRCAKACPAGARAAIDVAAGGVLCTSCGAVGPRLGGTLRGQLLSAMRGDHGALDPSGAEAAIALVDAAFEAHGRGEAS